MQLHSFNSVSVCTIYKNANGNKKQVLKNQQVKVCCTFPSQVTSSVAVHALCFDYLFIFKGLCTVFCCNAGLRFGSSQRTVVLSSLAPHNNFTNVSF